LAAQASVDRAEKAAVGVDMGVLNLFGLFGGGRTERSGYELYTAAVQAARQPFFYAKLGVPDTLDGRFDMVGLHAFLLIRRLSAEPAGQKVAQALFDAMFNDMDVNLREMGVGDLSVGKKVKMMWEAFHGRANAYSEALKSGPDVLADALGRNLWPGEDHADAAARLARLVHAQDAYLARRSIAQILARDDLFLQPELAGV
jgi:cytochrome b pre-mRNA-processing protein 3